MTKTKSKCKIFIASILLYMAAPSGASASNIMTIDAPGIVTYDFYLPFYWGHSFPQPGNHPFGAYAGTISADITVDWNAFLVTSANIVASGGDTPDTTFTTSNFSVFPRVGVIGFGSSPSLELSFDPTSLAFINGYEATANGEIRFILANAPGPVAGAGIPGLLVLLGFGGFYWKRRAVVG